MKLKQIHKNNIVRFLLTGLILSLISGCGFKLRGSDQSQQMLTPVKITGVIKGSPFYRTLEQFVMISEDSLATLEISEYRQDHRRLTISNVPGPQLYSSRIILKASYSDPASSYTRFAVPVEMEREYSFDSTNPVGLNYYQQQVTRQLMEATAMSLGRRIAQSQKQAIRQ